jgi:hypothetical protein
VTFEKDGKHFLLEPQARFVGLRFPPLDTLRYKPDVSAEWDGKRAHFFFHEERSYTPPVWRIPALVLERVYYRARLFFMAAYWLSVGLWKLPSRKFVGRKKIRV